MITWPCTWNTEPVALSCEGGHTEQVRGGGAPCPSPPELELCSKDRSITSSTFRTHRRGSRCVNRCTNASIAVSAVGPSGSESPTPHRSCGSMVVAASPTHPSRHIPPSSSSELLPPPRLPTDSPDPSEIAAAGARAVPVARSKPLRSRARKAGAALNARALDGRALDSCTSASSEGPGPCAPSAL